MTLNDLTKRRLVTAALPTPQISGIKEVSGHNKSAALVFTHPANRSDITESLWIAHNGPVTAAPVITLPPTSQTVNIGARLALRALATGGGLTWEWRRGGTLISTATHGELVLDPWTAADAGAWTVTVSNTSGSTSANFTLTAATTQITPPSFIAQIPSRHVLLRHLQCRATHRRLDRRRPSATLHHPNRQRPAPLLPRREWSHLPP